MMSKTDMVKAKLAKNPNPSPQEIKNWADEIHCAKSLIYKWIKRMPDADRRAEKASEPVVKIEEGSEEVLDLPVEETAEEFEVPEEFEGEEEAEPTEEITEEEEPAETTKEEEQRILKAISKRAVGRLFNIAIVEGLSLEGYGLTDQEAKDTEFLIMLMISKYLLIEVKENMLEVTGALHFGSIGAKLIVAWLKKRAKEKKEEKPVKLEPAKTEEKAEPPKEEQPVEVTLTTAEEAKEDEEEVKEKQTKAHEKKYLKKLGIG